MPILTKRIYDPAAEADGFRLLVMRLWPRGIRKDHISLWEKELGPSRKLLDDFHAGIPWAEYRMRYRAEILAKPDLVDRWSARSAGETITLLCGCKDETRCHRTLLREILEGRGARDPTPGAGQA
jgi:uncharacterized protein YeaO (DUF488 family)